MGMLRICATDGCQVKTLGQHCIHHEVVPPITTRLALQPVLTVPLAVVRPDERVPVAAA